MNWQRRLGLAVLVVVGCTETNPYAGEDGSSSTGPTTGAADDAGPSTSVTASATTPTTASEDESESAEGTSADSVSTTVDTTGPEACPIGTHVCVPAVPEGWLGPVALVEGPTSERDPGCGELYGAEATVAYDDLVAPAAVCTCTCGEPSDTSCDVELARDNSAGCGSPTNTWGVPVNGCVPAVSGSPGSYWQASAPPPDGTCEETATDDVDEAEFDTRVRLCSASERGPGVCEDGGVCSAIPVAPFGEALCVYAEGDLECPADSGYDVRRVVHRDLVDNRGCTTCSCAIEGECTGSVYLLNTTDCSGMTLAGSAAINGACSLVNLGVESAEMSASFEVEASCDPSGGAPEGEAVATDPVTLCCRA